MSLFSILMGQMFSFVMLALVMFGVAKLFRLSSDLTEIKDLLAEMKRQNSDSLAGRGPSSPVGLIRAVNEDAHMAPPFDYNDLTDDEKRSSSPL